MCAAGAVLAAPGGTQTLPYLLFERYIDALRVQVGIPGMSAAVLRDGAVEWERGLGRQDVERNVAALPDTPYRVGGLTQSISAAMLQMCADRGMLAINHAIGLWAPAFPAPEATVRHVMAHASDELPFGRFRYDPGRYDALGAVALACTGRPLAAAVAAEILDRLGMASSVPGADLASPESADRALFDAGQLARYRAVLERAALPYRVGPSNTPVRSDAVPPRFSASTGLVTNVRDLARFVGAMEQGVLLRADSLALAWSPAGFGGPLMPTGLGWFVQETADHGRLVWQFGHEPDASSALIVRLANRRLTLILLANSGGLAAGVNLEQGDVTASPFVRIFLRLLV